MLKEKREEAGLTQAQLAKAADVPRRTIQNWELDVSQANVARLKRVADVLGCRVDDLI